MKNIRGDIAALIAGISLTLFSIWYGQNYGLMLRATSPQSPLVDGGFSAIMTIATGLFLLIAGGLIIVIFRFCQCQGDMTNGPSVYGNGPLENVWNAVPHVKVSGLLFIALMSITT